MLDWIIRIFMSFTCLYHAMVVNPFLNTAADDAGGFEAMGDLCLTPFQYLFCGQTAHYEEGQWRFFQRFDYKEHFWLKTIASISVLPQSLVLGGACKTVAYLYGNYADRIQAMYRDRSSTEVTSHLDVYRNQGIDWVPHQEMSWFQPLGYERHPGDQLHLKEEKQALQAIAALFNKKGIMWWVDCGSCLGVYRYGGAIPWDYDVDIAILLPDFDNALHALNELDANLYHVQDWSGRDCPKSYIKVYIKATHTFLDIYHFQINEEKRQLQYVLSLENNVFLSELWKIRERRFKVPVSFETVFPLKKAFLDGVEVFMPCHPETYLTRYYGEDLSPARIYNPETGKYEKKRSHRYWQRAHAH